MVNMTPLPVRLDTDADIPSGYGVDSYFFSLLRRVL